MKSKSSTVKEKVSAFEFAIMQVADPRGSKKYDPITKEEETEARKQKLINDASKLKVKKP